MHFRRAVIGTRFHIQDFLLLFHLRIVFRLLYGGCFRLFLPVPFRHLPKSLALFRCHIHHHFIETVDGRIVFPVNGSIDVVRIALLIRFLHFLFLVRFLFSQRNRGGMRRYIRNLRCNLHFRFGRGTLCGISFFAAFFFLEGSSLLTSSVIPQRSSRESCTPSECFIGRCGSISGFSSVGCGVTSSGFATVSGCVTFSICGCISGVETISPSVLLLCAG
ncbi:hypothetical protein, membrane [gut metagenome]|uniref:Uncharacterized protein n=1 Tax=gut metagenome TaxID=749906 RepID=J9G6S5_9ZZZZ